MIIYEGNSCLIDSTFSDSKFDENAKYWIEDNSEIANFIINSNGHFKVTKSDETGKILSVEEYYPIEELKTIKKQEINQACSSLIHSGYDYNGEHFDLTDEDQINIIASLEKAKSGLSVRYHSSKPNKEGSNPCRLYSAEEFIAISTAITNFKENNLTYCNLLKLQLDEMTDSEEIKAVTYGTTQLNEKYQTILNTIIGGEVCENGKAENNQSSVVNAEKSDTI